MAFSFHVEGHLCLPYSQAEILGSIIQSLHAHSRDLKGTQDAVFVDPLKRLMNVYKQVELQAKQREQKLQEYERQQAKLEKQGRKTTGSSQYQQQSGKLELSQRAVSTARADYERVHDRLMLEVPQLLEGRVEYFDICLVAVMKAQSLYYKECGSRLLDGLENLRSSDDRDALSEDSIEQTTAADLAAIRLLSIVGSQSLINTLSS